MSRTTMLALAVAALLLDSTPAKAQAVYWDKASLLKDLFATSERVSYRKVEPTPAQRAAIRSRLGYDVASSYTVFFGTTGDHVDGYALIDEELGQHLPITFGVLVDPDGRMQRLEVLVYRESKGSEVREQRFGRQFAGKTASSPLRLGDDVVAVSGATISSKAMARGSKRALVLIDELVRTPGLPPVATR